MLRSAALADLKPQLVVLVLLDTCVNCLSITTMSSPLHTAILPCNFTLLPGDINLRELNVVWTRWTMPVAQYIGGKVTSGLRFSLREDRLKSGDASLHLSPVSMEDEGQYLCQVRYRTEKMDIEVNLTVRAPPQVHATIRTATHGSQGVVNCSATGFYPEGIKIAIQQDRETLKSESPSARRELDGTFSASSIYTFNWTTRDKELFICEVSHPALKQPIRRDARADSSILLLTNAVPGVKSVVICLSHRTQESVSKIIWRQGDTIVLIDNPNILMTVDGHMSVMSRYPLHPRVAKSRCPVRSTMNLDVLKRKLCNT
ncbi:tapasin-related protein-like [Erpetoichthys calabaricus]|uniref:tapasin-related protein-like n=1 Tax=Erpetoichthys calabaricus TaxID=27687 RepID=UPI0022344EDD|nr:tapasin-related protein-like [Erpetoichthys calabaricus]